MDIEFDAKKSRRNEAERGFYFAFAARVFSGRLVFEDRRQDYGELRMIAIGSSREPPEEAPMANVRMTLEDAAARGRIDHVKVEATTEADNRRHMIEDGFDPDRSLQGLRRVHHPAEIRSRVGMSQEAFAEALHVPVETLRNWEQGRNALDPAVASLMKLVADDPIRAFEVLSQ